MEKNQFIASMESLLNGMEGFLSSKTVVGQPVSVGDATVLPLVDVSFGCASGATAASGKREGTAGGMNGKISPTAVLVIQNGTCKLVNVKATDNVSRMLDMVPELVNRFVSNSEPEVTLTDDEAKSVVEE